MSHPILLYDGVCGLCNRFVQFMLKHDRKRVFLFASLQSALAAPILARHGADASILDTVYVVLNYNASGTEHSGEAVLARSDAVVFVLRELGGIWSALGLLVRILPRAVRNWGYGVVARRRYQIFGRFDACPLPGPEDRERFLDV